MLNEVTLVGYTGRNVEARTTQGGQTIGNLSVATTKNWKDRNTGEKREKTTWHNVVIFREQTVKFLQQYAPKGSLVMVKGELSKRKYTGSDNVERETAEVLVGGYDGSITLLLSKDDLASSRAENPGAPIELDDETPF